MKINVVNEFNQLEQEIYNECQGAFASKEEAEKFGQQRLDNAMESLDNAERTEDSVSNDNTYIQINFEEVNLKLEMWTLTVVSADPLEECQSETSLYTNKENALKALEKAHIEWINERKELYDEDYEMSFEDWLNDAAHEDIETDSCHYIHYIYDAGSEKIFHLQMHEV